MKIKGGSIEMIGICNLCGSVVVRIHLGYFGTRCLNCRYTKINRAVGLTIESLNFSTSTSVYELSSRELCINS